MRRKLTLVENVRDHIHVTVPKSKNGADETADAGEMLDKTASLQDLVKVVE